MRRLSLLGNVFKFLCDFDLYKGLRNLFLNSLKDFYDGDN